MKKTYRIKTNNQEQLQRKQNESDATSKWIEFQKTRPRRRIQDKDVPVMTYNSNTFHLWRIWSQAQNEDFFKEELLPGGYILGLRKQGKGMLELLLNGGWTQRMIRGYTVNLPLLPWRNPSYNERIRKRYERKRIKIEKLLTLGYTTSGDPWKITTK